MLARTAAQAEEGDDCDARVQRPPRVSGDQNEPQRGHDAFHVEPVRPWCARDNAPMVQIRWEVRAALLAMLCTACSPELNWREWRSTEVGLVQLFPCKPVRQQRTVRLAARELKLVLLVCDAGGVTWALAQADTGDPAAVGPALDALVGAAHANLGAPRAAAVSTLVPGATTHAAGGRYALRGRTPDGRTVEAAMLAFAKGTVVVQVTALGTDLAADAVATFLGSVRADS